MESICEICDEMINEGHVCRECREKFKPLSKSDIEFAQCLCCMVCDKHWFPCHFCAKDVFEYRLGPGNGSRNIGNILGDPLDLDQMLHILNEFDAKHDKVEQVTDPDISHERKKRSYYSKYCSIQ